MHVVLVVHVVEVGDVRRGRGCGTGGTRACGVCCESWCRLLWKLVMLVVNVVLVVLVMFGCLCC